MFSHFTTKSCSNKRRQIDITDALRLSDYYVLMHQMFQKEIVFIFSFQSFIYWVLHNLE